MDLDPPHPSEMGGVEATPVSQLHPDISDPASRVVAGVVTVTWPYSKVNRSIAFILAEHDARLPRDRGRLRVEFHGAAGRAVEGFGIGAGDNVRISLEGAHWERNQVASRHPVPPLAWQLKFKDLLHMRIRRDEAEAEATEAIDVDVSAAPGSPHSEPDYDLSVLFEPQPQVDDDLSVPGMPRLESPTKQTAPAFDSGEYASPAYLKRARMSYGSLFEGGFDLFDEEYRTRKRRRRRSRFSLNASWRYTSRSPSPQAEQLSESDSEIAEKTADDDAANEAANEPQPMEIEPPVDSTPRPPMVDQGCQTQELDYTPRMGVQVAAESRLTGAIIQSTPTPIGRYETPYREGLAPPPLSYHRAASPSKDDHFPREPHYPDSHHQDHHLLPADANVQHGQFDWVTGHQHHQQDAAAFHPESMMIDPNLQPHDGQDHYQAHVAEANGTREGETPMVPPHFSTSQAEPAHIQHASQSPCPPGRIHLDEGLKYTATHDFAQHTPRSPVMEAPSPIHREHEQTSAAIHDDHDLVQAEDRHRQADQPAEVEADGSHDESSEAEEYHYAWGHQGQHGHGSEGDRRDNDELDEEDYDEDSEEDYDEELDEDDFEGRRETGRYNATTFAREEQYEDDDEDEDEEDGDEDDEDEYDVAGYPVPTARPVPRAPQEPVVISLLSDSEDDQDDAVETPRPPVAAPGLSFQDRIRALQQRAKGAVAEQQMVEEVEKREGLIAEKVDEEDTGGEEGEEEESEVEEVGVVREYDDEGDEDEEEDEIEADEDEEEEEDESEAHEIQVQEVEVAVEKAEAEELERGDVQVREVEEDQDEEMEVQEMLEHGRVKVVEAVRPRDARDDSSEDQAIEVEDHDTTDEAQEADNLDAAQEHQQIEAESPDTAEEHQQVEVNVHDTAEEDVEMDELPPTEAKGENEEAAHVDADAVDEAAVSYTPMHSPPAIDREDSQDQDMRHEAGEPGAAGVNVETSRQDAGERANVTGPTDDGQKGEAQALTAEAPATPEQTIPGTAHEEIEVRELSVTRETIETDALQEPDIPATESSTALEHPGPRAAAVEGATTAEEVQDFEEPAAEDSHPAKTVQEPDIPSTQEASKALPESEPPTHPDEHIVAMVSDAMERFNPDTMTECDFSGPRTMSPHEFPAFEAPAELWNLLSNDALKEPADIDMISEAQEERRANDDETGASISQTVQTVSSEVQEATSHVEVTSKVEVDEAPDGVTDRMETEEAVVERTENAVEPEDIEMDDGTNEPTAEIQHIVEHEAQEVRGQEEAAHVEEPLPHDDQPQAVDAQEEGHGVEMAADGEVLISQEAPVHGLDDIQKPRELEEDAPSPTQSGVTKGAKGLLPPPIIRPAQPRRKDAAKEAGSDSDSDDDDDMSAEQQLMDEFRASQSEHLHHFDDSASRPSFFHSFDGAHDEVQESPSRARAPSRPERTDLVITSQSLRSHCRRHRKSMSVESHETMETTYSRPRTPSMKHCLVDEAGTMPSPLWCVTHHGSDGHEDDPSVALARSNPAESDPSAGAAEETSSAGDGGPAARWSILRDRSHALDDPSVALAKSNEVSPESEPARRRGGSRYAASTGRRSVSPMKLRALRPRGKQPDVSVQLAKSNPE